jgi:transposase-like protein
MPRTRPPYPEQFRREAVELVRGGRSVKDVAESLGCSDQSLHAWVKQYQVDRVSVMTGSRALSARSCVSCGDE